MIRKITYNPAAGDEQEYFLQYVNSSGTKEEESFNNLIETHKRARELYKMSYPNSFRIVTVTIQMQHFDPRTTREINGKEIEHRQKKVEERLIAIAATPTEELIINMDVLV